MLTNGRTGADAPAREKESRSRGRRPRGWKGLTYTTRVTLTFALIAAMTALVAVGVLSFVWEQHFQTYTRENVQETADAISEQIAESYEDDGGWSPDIETRARLASVMYPGIGIVVVDSAGDTMFDSTRVVDGESGALQRSLAPVEQSKMATSPIIVDNVAVGSVRVWVYGSDTLLSKNDQEFRASSYRAMLFAAGLAIVLASCIGFLFARNLVNPINRMTKTAKAIKEGDLSARTNLRGEDEIAKLGETFDAMAESVEADRELERRLTTDVAHELRTPLMAIQSTVEAMVDGVLEADEERLETVNGEVQRLSRMVNALLKLSRIENRSNPMKKEVLNVGDLVAGIIGTHEAYVQDSGLLLSFEADPDVYVKGDADMIRQATANLLSNAVRYTPEGGSITVRVRGGEIMASISVEDTGIGLTPEEAKMVFSRFWRADAGRNRESGGLGIGLSIVKEIVNRHGGWVQVEGKKGEGARFTIHIPRYTDAVARAEAKAEKADQRQQHKAQQKAQRQQRSR